MKKIWEAALLFIGTLGWWGFVYPELCPDGEAYQEEYAEDMWEDGTFRESDICSGSGTFPKNRAISGRAGSQESGWQIGEIRIKSRLAEYVCQIRENLAKEKRLEDEE